MPDYALNKVTTHYRIDLSTSDAQTLLQAEGLDAEHEGFIPFEDRLYHRLEAIAGLDNVDYCQDYGCSIFVQIDAAHDTEELQKTVLTILGDHLVRCRQPALAIARRHRRLARAISGI